MYKKINSLFVCSVLLLSGCAGVKSSFDCDATTTDNCMTMTKASQLARDRAAKTRGGTPVAGGLPALVNLPAAPAPVVPSASASVTTTPVVSESASAGAGASSANPAPAPRPVAGTPSTPVTLSPVSRPVTSVVTPVPSCQSVRCDNPGTVHPQRRQDRIAMVWIAPWVDSDNVFHQPGRVAFVVSPAAWVLPSRIH